MGARGTGSFRFSKAPDARSAAVSDRSEGRTIFYLLQGKTLTKIFFLYLVSCFAFNRRKQVVLIKPIQPQKPHCGKSSVVNGLQYSQKIDPASSPPAPSSVNKG